MARPSRHNAIAQQLVDAFSAYTDTSEQLLRVLPQLRRMQSDLKPLAVHRKRKQRRLYGVASARAIGQLHVSEATGGDEMRVFIKILRPRIGAKGKPTLSNKSESSCADFRATRD